MTPKKRAAARDSAVRAAMMQVRAIEVAQGVTRQSIADMRDVLIELAKRRDLFPLEDFPPPEATTERRNALYRLSEDADHRFALYAQLSMGGTNSPAHDHTTWAVIVGMEGKELNRLYDPADEGGVAEKDQFVVEAGTGLALMPDDLHSIHIDGSEPVLNFHMYGLALEQLENRRYYKPETGEWKHFPASEGIRDLPMPA